MNAGKNKILEDESNMRLPSRTSSVSSLDLAFPSPPVEKKQKTPRTPKRKSWSESSGVSFDMVPSDIEEPPSRDDIRSKVKKSSTVDGLSVERLILLGRVHVARDLGWPLIK